MLRPSQARAMAAAFCLGEVPGRGRALRAARDIAAGEVVLTDWPILLTCSQDAVDSVCSCCLRLLQGPGERAASSALAQPMLPYLSRGCAGHQGPARARSVGMHASVLKRVRGPRWATPRATRLPPAGKPSRAAAQAVHLQVSLCCFAPTHRSSQRGALRHAAPWRAWTLPAWAATSATRCATWRRPTRCAPGRRPATLRRRRAGGR